MLERAKRGDASMMVEVARFYRDGTNGFQKDARQAYSWYERAHLAGNAIGTAHAGHMLTRGNGVRANHKKGVRLLALAAGRGSSIASFVLGKALERGSYGLEIDEEEALWYLQKCVCDESIIPQLNETSKIEVQQLIIDLSG